MIRTSLNSTAGLRARRLFVALSLIAAASTLALAAPPENSTPSRLAAKALLLDITRVGDRFVAVGDRGHIVLSADDGRTWSQTVVPTRSLLTSVAFADAQHGWAAGHDGVILATKDGGQTWSRQDSGEDLDSVFLDVLFLDAQRGFIIGAYGKFLETSDGGKTWRERRIHEEELHFNRLSMDLTGQLFIAGEAGLILHSKDSGKSWKRLEAPYEGSFYGVRPLLGGVLIAYGLRGHIFVSTDDGANWDERETDVDVLLMACARPRDGVSVLAGQGGNFYISRDSGRTFQHWKPEGFGTGVAELAVASDGALITVGEAGAVRLTLP